MKIFYSFFFLSVFLMPLLQAQSTLYDTIQHGGLSRTYILYVPASYTGAEPAPLVFNLHGYTSNNVQQSFYTNFEAVADTAGFLLVLPNGTLDGTNSRYWNVGFFASNIDDVGFLEAVIDSISAQYNVDPERVYSTGMSNGGFMSYELACRSGRFAAVASVTGSMTVSSYNACQPQRPVPAMQIHGTADPTVPYGGSALFKPVDTVVQYWVQHNQCTAVPSMNNVPNTNLTDGATAEHYVWSGGAEGASVELYKVINGAHTWPGASFIIGVTCRDFSATAEIWRFFRQYSRLPVSVPSIEPAAVDWRLYPNPVRGLLNMENSGILEVSLEWYHASGARLSGLPEHLPVGASLQADLSNLPVGLYWLRANDGKTIRTEKIVKH